MVYKIMRIVSMNKNALVQSVKDVRKFHCNTWIYNQGESTSSTSSSGSGSDKYMVPEYYQYNEYSYVDYETAMSKYRLPQPSSVQQTPK